MSSLKVFLLVLLLVAPGAVPARSQDAQDQAPGQTGDDPVGEPVGEPAGEPFPEEGDEPAVRLSVDLVQIDAVVTDKDGRHVTDLRREDFEIQENGRPQELTNFSYVSQQPVATAAGAPAGAPAAAPPLTREQVHRTIAVVVDDINVTHENMTYVRQGLHKFVENDMQAGDLVAILRTSGGGMMQQFTSDKRLLRAAIDQIRPYLLRDTLTDLKTLTVSARGAGGPPTVTKETASDPTDELLVEARLGGLDYIIRGLGPLPGRKALVLFSDSLAITFDPAGNARGARATEAASWRARDRVRRIVELATRSSVVVYTIKSTGLETSSILADVGGGGDPVPGDQLERRIRGRQLDTMRGRVIAEGGLETLAAQTGGLFLRDTNDFARALHRVVEDQPGYYLLGYVPEKSSFELDGGRLKYNDVTVRVKRPGLKVRTRNGYYGLEREPRPKPATIAQELLEAIVSPFSASSVRLSVTPLYLVGERDKSFVRAMVRIDASDLRFTEAEGGLRKATVDVLAAAYDVSGGVRQWARERYDVSVSKEEAEQAIRDGLVYTLTVPIEKPGGYQVRAVVRDAESGRLGSASQFVEIPKLEKDRMALSGVVVTGADSKTKATVDPAIRRFRPGMALIYQLYVYNPAGQSDKIGPELQSQVRILGEDGRVAFEGIAQRVKASSDGQPIAVQRQLRLGADLKPGDYTLQVVVTDLRAKNEAARVRESWSDFTIE